MRPISPVVPGLPLPEVVIAKDQPQYQSLPAIVTQDGIVTTRWEFSAEDLERILSGGSLYLSQMTFTRPGEPLRLQPVMIGTVPPPFYRDTPQGPVLVTIDSEKAKEQEDARKE